jgi:hypothetical protein
VLMACSCAPTDDGSRTALATRGSGARGFLPFLAELPWRRGILGGRERSPRGGGGDVLCRSRSTSRRRPPYRQPPSRAPSCGDAYPLQPPTATHLPARRHPCAPATPNEPEAVAPLAEASLVVVQLIELALVEFFMCGCGGAGAGQGH